MDAAEADFDIKLQKISGDLIEDYDRSVQSFLRKPDGHGGTRVRSLVRARETYRLAQLLDTFQELPQLIDSHLPKWIPFLAESYLEFLQTRRRKTVLSPADLKLLLPTDRAICSLLYHICKIRGEKVIVRFLNAETKYLELLLSAIEESETQEHGGSADVRTWAWEQRYIVLLWLSHLMLAPFDLATISSVDVEEVSLPELTSAEWHPGLPGITSRSIALGVKYLSTPGKERDAAKALLVRVAMRKDMQQLGVLHNLVQWAKTSISTDSDSEHHGAYFYLGVLSFLAGVLRASSETSDMDEYLRDVFGAVSMFAGSENPSLKSVVSLTLTKKLIIKIYRLTAVSVVRQAGETDSTMELVEQVIGDLLEYLGHNDTPVRLATSKALSIVTLQINPGMASQVVSAVLDMLNRNVLWENAGSKPVRDLSGVDASEWHGLMLTLSHLLYRRSPPASTMSSIIHALILGLSFEQRGTSGVSIGGNVRDAACFGIWAVARRYSTEELSGIPADSVYAAKIRQTSGSILQVLATELVVTASLDPSGNIRRGSSAALQELIGRHPDTVVNGISVVQSVDYHAVARRSRAVEEVALNAAKLSHEYAEALLDDIMGWKGIGDPDAPSRRNAATSFGNLTSLLAGNTFNETALAKFEASITLAKQRLDKLQTRQVEERHGIFLCLARVIEELANFISSASNLTSLRPHIERLNSSILTVVISILNNCRDTKYRRPELIAEAASELVISITPLLQWTVSSVDQTEAILHGRDIISSQGRSKYLQCVASLDAHAQRPQPLEEVVTALQSVIPGWLLRNEEEVVQPASAAALVLLIFSKPDNRARIISEWADLVKNKPSTRAETHGNGYYFTLANAQPLVQQKPNELDIVCKTLIERWRKETETEAKAWILQCITGSKLLQTTPDPFLDMLADALDDYTTDARGDVGSHVRVQALKAVKKLWSTISTPLMEHSDAITPSVEKLIFRVLRLAAEKLDRIRPEAQSALSLLMEEPRASEFRKLTFSSEAYFQDLLRLDSSNSFIPPVSRFAQNDRPAWIQNLLAGYTTSADTGNEDLVIASRAALCAFCQSSTDNTILACLSLMQNLRTYETQDRVLIPTLELIAFLFNAGIFQQAQGSLKLRNLSILTQKAGYKAGNMRKILACIKVYGGIASTRGSTDTDGKEEEDPGPGEARKRLGLLMAHPWPKVRSAVVDEIWGLLPDHLESDEDGHDGKGKLGGLLTGVDWAKAKREDIKAVAIQLDFA